ncbi:MAG: 2-C-methyl-D-erythritol 4-phosphate cytidylyltransferase [Flavobacteriales bacterium]
MERLGAKVALVEGEDSNIKVTTALDLRLAELALP